jgi:hypothetical protein
MPIQNFSIEDEQRFVFRENLCIQKTVRMNINKIIVHK